MKPSKTFASLLGVIALGCGASSMNPKMVGGCSVAAFNAEVQSLTCVQATQARALGLALSPDGQHAVVGSYAGSLSVAETPAFGNSSAGKFLWTAGRDLARPKLVAVSAPGWVRSISVGPRGVALITDSPSPPEGPFLTVYDPYGTVSQRVDLGFGGITTSAVAAADGFILRQQASGIRLVQITSEGHIVGASPLLTPFYAYEFPLSVAENGVVSELALAPDQSAFVLTTRPTTGEPGEPSELLRRVSPNGNIVWQRGFWLGRHSQLARLGDGVVVLSADTSGFCGELRPHHGFALTRIDAVGQVRWQRCLPGDVHALRLATNGTELAVSGQFESTFQLEDSRCTVAPEALGSFVAWFHDAKWKETGCFGTAEHLVAIQSLAMHSDGRVSIAGAVGVVLPTKYQARVQQRQLFLATLGS